MAHSEPANQQLTTPADSGLSASPFGDVGCKCGRGPHATIRGKCAGGHPLPGFPGDALNTGERSELFWRAVADQQGAIVRQVLLDHGHTEQNAPEAVRQLAGTLAEAVLLKASAFQRVCEMGGPLTASDRGRRAFEVWNECAGKVMTATRALGLSRVPRPTKDLAEVLAAHEEI